MIAKYTCSLDHKIPISMLTFYWNSNKFQSFKLKSDNFTTPAKNSVNKNINNLVFQPTIYRTISFIIDQQSFK